MFDKKVFSKTVSHNEITLAIVGWPWYAYSMNKLEIAKKVQTNGFAWVPNFHRREAFRLITEDERFAWKYGKSNGIMVTFAKPGVKRDGFMGRFPSSLSLDHGVN